MDSDLFQLPFTGEYEHENDIRLWVGKLDTQHWTSLKQNMTNIQHDLKQRLSWKNLAKNCIQQSAMGEAIQNGQVVSNDEFIKSVEIIQDSDVGLDISQEGDESKVYRAILRSPSCMLIPVSVKITPLKETENEYEYGVAQQKIDNEGQCLRLSNQLLETGKSIHFPFIIERFVVQGKSKKMICTIMEYLDGELFTWLNHSSTILSLPIFFSLYVQSVFTLVSMATHDMIHGNLSHRHVMYSLTKKNLSYNWKFSDAVNPSQNIVYTPPSSNIIIKFVGLSNCETQTQTTDSSHRFMPMDFYETKYWNPKAYSKMNKYARDLLTLTGMFTQLTWNDKFSPLRPFFQMVENQIKTKTNSDPSFLKTLPQLMAFVRLMFTEFLSPKQRSQLNFTIQKF